MTNIFNNLSDYNKYFENQLALSGTILGLIVATSTFILQSGFTSFQYSRSMFVKYYVQQSKFIFLCLAYNTLFPLLVLYFSFNQHLFFIFHVIFALTFAKYFLDFQSHKGYILTLHSSKFNPHKTGILKYFRFIRNLGFIQNVFIYGTIYFIFFYPLHFNRAFRIDIHQIYMTTVSCLGFCILILIRIIPQYFTFSEQEFKSKTKNEVTDNLDSDITKENEILRSYLIKNGRNELRERIKTEHFDSLSINMPESKKEAFFVVYIEINNKDINEIVNSIKTYCHELFLELITFHVDVNNFVLSLFVKINGEAKSRGYFLRASRTEIEDLKSKHTTSNEFIDNIRNKVLDDLFRNL